MRFDDRLLTVLKQPAEDRHDAAVRWRQLVDLVARAGANSTSSTVPEALVAIRNEARRVEEPLRAAAARAVAALPLPFGLLEYFASDSLTVGAPVLAAANLDSGQWSVLHSAADAETRAFIETLHPEIAGQSRDAAARMVPLPNTAAPLAGKEPETPHAYMPPSLHQVVERIEERRRLRAAQQSSGNVPAVAPAEAPALFRWECGPSGEIAWVEGAPRGGLIGRSLAKPIEGDGDRIDQEVVRAFTMRAPFRDGLLKVAFGGSASGEWKISGVPAFDPTDGRFAGYRGVALRERRGAAPDAEPAAETLPDVLADPASLRELVHEIKTPLNAIIGFAEIIEGQYLGPADRGYRNRAYEIVRQARLLLTAIDDLDFAAKLHAASGGRRERVDLASLLDRESGQLREIAAERDVHVDILSSRFDVPVTVEPELVDRLLFRLFGALADLAESGEGMQLSVEIASDDAGIMISRPNALRGLSDAELFGSASDVARGGFMLRLARGLARIAGGDLVPRRDALALVFPRA
ncbi:MAG TPA: histidine kinase dimerization/phospho-acceptor domain-containing protein [Sphingomicrobium sp.]|nr:histidine kinase dimerization/phospho-acceptor domain-containing protein [Sphingomicrobium sp.]